MYPIHEDEHGTYMMNAKDLCSIELLDDLMNAGVVSFKIEGRTKSAYYAAMTTRIYRQAIDDVMNKKPFQPQYLVELNALSHRPYTTGFYARNPKNHGIAYDESRSREFSHHVVAELVRFDEGLQCGIFNIKNPISVGQSVELITPHETQNFTIEKIMKSDLAPINKVSGGVDDVFITMRSNPGNFCFLRSEI